MRRALLVPAFALLIAGCDNDVFGPGRGYEGFYTYAGTVEHRIGHVVVGNLWVDQRGRRVEVDIEWEYFDNAVSVVQITSETPAIAAVDEFGNIDFDFEGDLFIDNQVVGFRLEHRGRLEGTTIHGDWRFITGLPTTDEGSFTADR
jgi:hypothetical protein